MANKIARLVAIRNARKAKGQPAEADAPKAPRNDFDLDAIIAGTANRSTVRKFVELNGQADPDTMSVDMSRALEAAAGPGPAWGRGHAAVTRQDGVHG